METYSFFRRVKEAINDIKLRYLIWKCKRARKKWAKLRMDLVNWLEEINNGKR